ncbi:MAG TPA: circadian clock KaiB family protein [Bacteroidales bacterium]|jgi:circadian clock protein KaiB|nr:circadian clock KaiB family protein [Bacteroidales bacterium]
MGKRKIKSDADALKEERQKAGTMKYLLKLYVTGTTPHSVRAINNIKEICEEYLKGRYTLEVIDLYKHPEIARSEQIIAAPTLIRKLPLPLRRVIGDLSGTDKVLIGLDLSEKKE